MIAYPIISLASFFIVFFLGTLVYAENKQHPVNRLFLVFSLLVGIYNLSEFGFSMARDFNTAKFWLKLQMIWPIIYFAQYHMVLIFTTELQKINKRLIITGYIISIMISFYCMFGLHYEIFEESNTWLRLSRFPRSKLIPVLYLFLIVFTILPLYHGGRFMLSSKERNRRNQIGLFMMAVIIPTIYNILKESVLPALHIVIMVPISVAVFIGWLFVALSIWKFRLFDITPEFAARNIISTIRDGLVLVNNRGNILSANKAFIKLSGIDEPNLLGHQVDFFFKRCHFNGIDIPDLYLKYELKNQPFIYNSIDNGKLYMHFSNSNILDKKGKLMGYAFVIADITSYVKIQNEMKDQHQQMLTLAHRAGMAEIASGVMHNIGNLMNSLNVSTEKILEILKFSKLSGLTQANRLFSSAMENHVSLFNGDAKINLLPKYYEKLAVSLENEQARLKEESTTVLEKVILIKEAIELQQDYARFRNFNEPVNVVSVIDEALRILEPSFLKHDIIVEKKIENVDLEITTSRTRLMNILLNLFKNAMESINQNYPETKLIEVALVDFVDYLQISVIDNGAGIASVDFRRLFNYGFTTKSGGHGFGLHFCANAIKEMNGTIEAFSDGIGKGAEFKLTIPKSAEYNPDLQ